jgi:hypothetical protein
MFLGDLRGVCRIALDVREKPCFQDDDQGYLRGLELSKLKVILHHEV